MGGVQGRKEFVPILFLLRIAHIYNHCILQIDTYNF